MKHPLMPKATALWLINNTALTFQQIADFCGLHRLEVEALADEEDVSVQEINPITNGQLTQEEIDRCTKDTEATLRLSKFPVEIQKKTTRTYTPLSKRHERPAAVLWLLKNHPQLSMADVCKLVRTTRNTVESIKAGTLWNHAQLSPRDPVLLGFCTKEDLDAALSRSGESQS